MTIEQAVEHYKKKIYTMIYYSVGCDENTAEDYTEDVFCAMIASWNRIEEDRLYGWLLSTVNNKLKEHYRLMKKYRTVPLDVLDKFLCDNTDMTDRIFSDQDIAEKKAQLLAALSTEERMLYEDHFSNKMTYYEIADKLGIKYNAVSARMVKLREKLETEVYKTFGSCGAVTVLRLIIELFYKG